ncbi:hypothetical protein [Vreelandella olivaria]|nr:hypothetical protein [Halomonas olivaria]
MAILQRSYSTVKRPYWRRDRRDERVTIKGDRPYFSQIADAAEWGLVG